jgi:N-acetyl-anhydromuramyl-L-alanine amidase AmpD
VTAAEQTLRDWCASTSTELVDFRDLEAWPRERDYKGYGYPLDKSRAHPPSKPRRPWSKIKALMLHTTAVAGMKAKRGLGLPAHLYVPADNAIVLCHDLDRLLYHGHAGNGRSVGLEISGVSAWDTPSQVERVRALLRYFRDVRRELLGLDAVCEVMAHRQTHSSRVNDPGAEIWRDAGEWAIAELGYVLGPVLGTGRTIDAWR